MDRIAMAGAAGEAAPTWERIALAAAAGVSTVCAVLYILAIAGVVGPTPVNWLVPPLAAGLAAAVAWRTGSCAGVAVAARAFWRRIAVALTVVAAALVSRLVDTLNADWTFTARITVHSVVGQLIGVALVVVAVYRLPSGAQSTWQRVGLVLDVAAVTLGASVFVWHFIMRPLMAESVELMPVLVIGGSLLLCGVTAVFVSAKLAFTGGTSVHRRSMLLLGSALAVAAVGPSLGPLLAGRSLLGVSLLPVPLALFLVTLAARHQRVRPAEVRVEPDESPQPRFSLLPYAAIVGTDVLLLVTLGSASVHERMVVGAIAVVLTVTVVCRQVTALRENGRLLSQLRDSIGDLRTQEERFRSLVQNSHDVVTIMQPGGRIDYLSGGSQRMFGREPSQRIGGNVFEVIHPDHLAEATRHFDRVAATPGATALLQTRFSHADGSWRWIEVLSTNMLHDPAINGIISNSRDVTEAHELQERLSYEATHDVLTGLANRALFSDRVEQSVSCEDRLHQLSIVLIDLDNFKTVNDMLGHAVGDALLVMIAERMRLAVRPADTVARLGGDEFAILLESVGADVDVVIERIIQALRQPVFVEGHSLVVQASFGVAVGGAGDDAGDLLRRADIAMYEAKAKGDGRWQHYRPGMEARGADRNRLADELRQALENGEMRVFYQPVVTLPSGEIDGVEALVRWEHPERGLVAPNDFIPLAEETGLIVPLGRWVLREACEQAVAWRARHGDGAPRTIAVNVSARQLQESGFAEEVMAALLSSGLEPGRLILEITESTAVGGGATQQSLRSLRDLGVRVALDDFGTGQSTLSLLASCPVDQIKLDRSFAPLPSGDVIARAVVELARVLGLEVVAEGVESESQSQRLHTLGYAHAQGFHFARPMDAAALDAMLCGGPATAKPGLTVVAEPGVTAMRQASGAA